MTSMTWTHRWFFLVLLVFAGWSSSHAGFYAKPRAGMAVPLSGSDPFYSLGGTIGYQWISLFGTEVTYLRLLGHDQAPDGQSLRAQGVFSAPIGLVKPFASLGVGWLDIDYPGNDDSTIMTVIGGGISTGKILFFTAAVGVEYSIVPDDKADFIEPYVTLGIAF